MSIPYLKKDKGGSYFVVHDQPFLPLGGELHNSSGSDLKYLEEHVWPALRPLGGNFYLTPVYWEFLEPQEGVFDFTLVDGVIAQARREKVKLGLLWFGTWKNGASDYLPVWLKQDHDRYFLARDEKGRPINAVSTFCEEVRRLDVRAFSALMRHLKEMDGQENTVITVQVENEVGIWMHDRDFCEQANKAFAEEIPQEVSERFGLSGTWEEAFGKKACDQFEAYQFAGYVETVAVAGKAEYPIPMFVNCVATLGEFCPAGGPNYGAHQMWMAFAPSIDFFSPDVYAPEFQEICTHFVHDGNSLFIPETGAGMDAVPKFLYAVGALNCFGFNPFGCEDFFDDVVPVSDLDWANVGAVSNYRPGAGQRMRKAYEMVWALWPEIRRAHEEGRIFGFLQGKGNMEQLDIPGLRVKVGYGRAVRAIEPARLPEEKQAALGGGFLIQLKGGEYLFAGTNCYLNFEAPVGGTETVFVMDKRELLLENGVFRERRCLNGDQRNVTGIGLTPAVLKLRLDVHC